MMMMMTGQVSDEKEGQQGPSRQACRLFHSSVGCRSFDLTYQMEARPMGCEHRETDMLNWPGAVTLAWGFGEWGSADEPAIPASVIMARECVNIRPQPAPGLRGSSWRY